jgi:hypothetical protein
VGGFTVTSAPRALPPGLRHGLDAACGGEGALDLAVKRAPRSRPAEWLHTAARVGDVVQVRMGGSFVQGDPALARRPVLFVAGGVGINPLYAMLLDAACMGPPAPAAPPVRLLYSVRRADDALFLPELQKLATHPASPLAGRLQVALHVTRHGDTDPAAGGSETVAGDQRSWLQVVRARLSADDLAAAVRALGRHSAGLATGGAANGGAEGAASGVPVPQVDVFACGPPALLMALDAHHAATRGDAGAGTGVRWELHREKWW